MKKDYKSKAKKSEKKAKQLKREYKNFLKEHYNKEVSKGYSEEALRKDAEMHIPIGEAYEDAGKNYLVAKNLKKAAKYYHLASREYGNIFNSKYATPSAINEFRKRCFRAIKISDRLKKVEKKKWHGLEGKATIILIINFILAIFFLSPIATGNTILNLTNQTSNIIGGALFIIGIIGSYFWVKKRK